MSAGGIVFSSTNTTPTVSPFGPSLKQWRNRPSIIGDYGQVLLSSFLQAGRIFLPQKTASSPPLGQAMDGQLRIKSSQTVRHAARGNMLVQK